MRRPLLLIAAAALLPAAAPSSTAAQGPPAASRPRQAPAPRDTARQPCVVERITDGDTIRCRGGLRVRLLLIDTPERTQKPFGQQAARELARLLPPGAVARLERDVEARDRYGRTLAYVYTPDGRMANEEMVRAGYAVVLVYPPNVRHVERLRQVAREAQAAKRGLWATSAFACLPRDHRAKRC